MCGIGGYIGQCSRGIGESLIKGIVSRGPDAQQTWLSSKGEFPATLCHTRLAIIDTSESGRQPFASSCGRYVLTYNGEIYNYRELRRELENSGVTFRSDCDTEVMLNGLILEGCAFLERCNGMWAFCLWDRKEETALLSRDRFGVKPLYYSIEKDGLVFSSVMKSIVDATGRRGYNKDLEYFFANQFAYENTEETIYGDIKRLRAGHALRFSDGAISIERWWNTLDHIGERSCDYINRVEHWKDLLIDAVDKRLRADVGVGSALSGGLDSSSIVAIVSSLSSRRGENGERGLEKHRSFCSRFEGSDIDESMWARRVADEYGSKLDLIDISLDNIGRDIEDGLTSVEDPYISMPIPMIETYKRVKACGISVTLDGHGADELLSGYSTIQSAILCTKSVSQMKEIIAIDESASSGIFSGAERVRLRKVAYRYLVEYLRSKGIGRELLKNLPVGKRCEASEQHIRIRQQDMQHQAYLEMDVFNQLLYGLFSWTTLPTLLRNYDRYSMAAAVEVRMPFMDWRLVIDSFSLPWTMKVGEGKSKRVLRDAMQGILIDEVRLRQKKIGWNAPMHQWLRYQSAIEYVDDLLDRVSDGNTRIEIKAYWNKFLREENCSFRDGMLMWNRIQPLAWAQAMNR